MVEKKPTNKDIEATLLLLKLRQQYRKEFDDQKCCKARLWQKIANILSENFSVGVNGSERCRQKFANLIKTYLSYKNKQKKTGEGEIDPPQFFEEIHSIIGIQLFLLYGYH